ncbi:hypothetical protein EIP91_002611 [Steccherinum ochraceum]|uniref:Defective in cullin neddylation protein n=1 Tax=Steccherinum ochraceum TaxID=92696 RepID=A0A4R0RPG2_9APHY|nr:hypothetical protein EIP91_002611 [Steccherinum ochraceum]
MPPKRKRATDEGAPEVPKATRSTRSSTRNKAAAEKDVVESRSAGPSEPEIVPEPAPKKQRKAPAKQTSKKTAKATANAKTEVVNRDDAPPAGAQSGDTATSKSTKSAVKAKPPADLSKVEPYTPARATALFAEYADDDDEDVIGPEGFERLCNDANISLEGALPLLLAWQLGATEMAKLKKSEWEKGTGDLRISSLPALSTAVQDLENLLIIGKSPLKPVTQTSTKKNATPTEPYNRARYFQYAADTKKAYSEFYMFLFVLTKPPQSRNIDMETACAFWGVAVAPKYPIINDIISFVTEKGTYKAVTKDLWSMMLEFCQTISPNLENYEADGAWPTLLDDFVSSAKVGKADDAPTDIPADQ